MSSRTQDRVRIDIVMPVFNNEDTILESLRSLSQQDFDGMIRAVVVDDGSTDNSREKAEFAANTLSRDNFNVVCIYSSNRGEASALNKGLDFIYSDKELPDYIGLIEADVKVERDWVKKLLAELSELDYSGAGGLLLPWEGINPIARVTGYDVEYRMAREGKFVPHLTSANVLYRRQVFDEHGRFNEGLRNAALDNDFNFRIISSGKRLVRCFEAKAYHKYKTKMMPFLKRQYYYAKYRPFLKYSSSYKGDDLIKVGVFLALAFFLSLLSVIMLAFSPDFIWVLLLPVLLLLANLIVNCIPLNKISRWHKDRFLFLYPVLMTMRAFAGLFGYGVGILLLLSKKSGNKMSKDLSIMERP